MIEKRDKVITGVSGGADSVCLLFMLCSLQNKMGFDVAVCHVNHGLRGKEADADERFVLRLCEKLGVPCRVFRENVELIARNRKQSLEEAGRMARRKAFETMCEENGGTRIATAHHSGDNAETVLLNVARGTGLRGLCGIHPVRGRFVRPMLCLSRKEIEDWLEENGISYCQDRTNEEDAYTRNRIRHNILPAIEMQVNPGAAGHLNELSRQAQEIWEYVCVQTDQAWEECVSVRGGHPDGRKEIRIDRDKFRKMAPALQKFLIQRCIQTAAESQRDIAAEHIDAVRGLFDKQTGKRTDLPHQIRAVRTYGGVLLRRQEKREKAGKAVQTELKIPGVTCIPGTNRKICCTLLEADGSLSAKALPQKSYTKCFDYDIIEYSLSARYRRPGDYLTIDGEGRKQKLKAYFINEKIPAEERGRRLLIADGEHIVWIPGMRMSSAYQIGEHTKRILKISITEGQ